MDIRRFFVYKAIGFVVVLVLVLGFFALRSYAPERETETHEPYRATLTGTHTCLPHRDTSGPQTMECAFGMETDDGRYFALDFSLMSQIPPRVQSGDRFTASGLVTPIENLSSDHWRKYDVEGIFSVTDGVIIESRAETPDAPVSQKKCYVGGCSSQLCTDTPDMASTCEYREEYACYQQSTCEVQADGECGWTETQELHACLSGTLQVI